MKRLKAYLRLFGTALSVNLSSALEYRANFALQVGGMMLNNAAFFVFWQVLLARTGKLGGYGLEDVMFLWALSPAAFGLGMVVFGNARQLARLVRGGELDVYLLQPKDVLFNALISRTSLSAWGDLAYGVIVFAFLGASWGQWLAFALFVVTGAVIFVALLVLGECLAFLSNSGDGLSATLLELMLSFSLYPEKIFPGAMRWVFYTILPTGFIVFLPLSFWRHPDPWLLAAIPAAAAAFAVLAWLVFRFGLKHYESGNRMGARR